MTTYRALPIIKSVECPYHGHEIYVNDYCRYCDYYKGDTTNNIHCTFTEDQRD